MDEIYQIFLKRPRHCMKSASDVIPRIIHQTWKTNHLPPLFVRCRRSWLRHHPSWSYRFYTDQDCHRFVLTRCPEFYALYRSLARPVQRADLFRYLVIYLEGGLYADMDMYCFKPLDPLMKETEVLFTKEMLITRCYQQQLGYAHPFQVANCIFAARPGQAFLKSILDHVKAAEPGPALTDADVESQTGPRMLTRLFFKAPQMMRDKIRLLPPICLMSPDIYLDVFPLNINMYARHLNAGTWKKKDRKVGLRQRLIRRNRLPWPWPL
jgi:inositol phosphorylceramide mannosyltransferase catalytic subunit